MSTRYDWVKGEAKTALFYVRKAKTTIYSTVSVNLLTARELLESDKEFVEILSRIRNECDEILKMLEEVGGK